MKSLRLALWFYLLFAVTFAIDEHRPKRKDDRSKRNLQNQISYHYSHMPSYRLERRISTGNQYPNPSQFYSRPFHKDSQSDLVTENDRIYNSIGHYGPPKPQIVERPVYIKEPEPIIEIIIKESNVSLPAPPPPPPPPKKKKEQVHVFYVKYKKNPHGVGKDSIIYDKPVPALSPEIPDDEEEEEVEAPYNYHKELATAPPPPSTTLRTIIKPDSELYHSPNSGIKVTFGKEGWDYDKRSSKPEDYYNSQPEQQQHQLQQHQPQGRQLTSFSNAYYKTPTVSQYHTLPPELRNNDRPRQSFRPITFPISSFGKQSSPSQFSQPQASKYFQSQHSRPNEQFNSFGRQPFPQFSHSISHPPPPTFQNSRPSPSGPLSREPVPYIPFDKFRQQHFSRPPSPAPSLAPVSSHFNPPHITQAIQFRPETHFPIHQQLPLAQPPNSFHSTRPTLDNNIQQNYRPDPATQSIRPQPQQFVQQTPQNEFRNQLQQPQQNQIRSQAQQYQQNQQAHNTQQLQHGEQNLQNIPNILPPGGQLIQSVPKYEQHISSLEPLSGQQSTHLGGQQYQDSISQRFNNNANSQEQHDQRSLQELQQFQLRQYLQQQQQQRSNDLHQPQTQQQHISTNTPRNLLQYQSTRKASDSTGSSTTQRSYQSTSKTVSSTTTEAPKPSTSTKDPKELEAKLPDEVPDDLREQLLASGILNNADISILDYDKVGDTPLSALPPDQLANFYSAGGGAQIASGSEAIPSIVQADGTAVDQKSAEEPDTSASEIDETILSSNITPSAVGLKVVHYDPQTEDGKRVQGQYIGGEAQEVNPVVLNDNSYNRYLPLKVAGAKFPLPDVPELKDKKIASVVILAPVSYDFSPNRTGRETHIATESTDDLIKSTSLETLMKNPSLENFEKFLERENTTKSDRQSVILLVFDPTDSKSAEKEIFMYDVSTRSVSKLNGELSSAFVEAAEANSNDEEVDDQSAPSDINEATVAADSGNHIDIDRRDVIPSGSHGDEQISEHELGREEDIMETEESQHVETVVDVDGNPVDFPSNVNVINEATQS